MTRRRRQTPSNRDYPRTARLRELLREIAADTIERFDDERLGLLTIQSVDVDAELTRAVIYYAQSGQPTDDQEAFDHALETCRRVVQREIGRQARIRRTPEVVLRPDTVVEEASRIEEILRDLHQDEQ